MISHPYFAQSLFAFQFVFHIFTAHTFPFKHIDSSTYPAVPSQQMSRHMGKPTLCIGENKGADQLRNNCEADQRLCFRYMDSTIPRYFLNPKIPASSHLLCLYGSDCVGPARQPHCWFSHEAAHILMFLVSFGEMNKAINKGYLF